MPLMNTINRCFSNESKFAATISILFVALLSYSVLAFSPSNLVRDMCGTTFPAQTPKQSNGCSQKGFFSSRKEYEEKDGIESLLESASRLRKEAEKLEAITIQKRAKQALSNSLDQSKPNYQSLQDSSWNINYRFSAEPQNYEENGKVKFYSGKVTIKLLRDGYTEKLDEKPSDGIEFQKVWGWDEDISREDNFKYVSFSADAILDSKAIKRFYFNGRVNSDSKTGSISITDGTVTVKEDVEPLGGLKGIFSAGGILAEFKYCGDFLMKPTL